MNNLKILNLHVQYDSKKYGGNIDYLKYLFRNLHRTKIDIVIINNKIEEDKININNDAVYINGDNSIWDFSGWQKGLLKLGSSINNYDLVILSNDSCPLNSDEYKNELKDVIFEYIYSTNIVTGIVWALNMYDDFKALFLFKPQEYFIKSKKFNYWIRSNFIIIPVTVLKKINWNIINIDEIFNDEYSTSPYKDNILSDNLQEMILNYLCSKNKEEKKIWHSRFDYEYNNYTLFCTKATTIVNEMWLSALLVNCNVKIVDVRLLKILILLDCILNNINIYIINVLEKNITIKNAVYYYSKRIIKYICKNGKKSI